ncbi:SDR family oxidoreductase [Magnetovibrio sp.]|uniref:SDR family oxidoreductase n=1 Tax=Magnetovibrio sp. TaxID=2024836 RepID=UPI002F93283C
MTQKTPHLFCFGLGYSASWLALDLQRQGWRVTGTHRPGDDGGAGALVFDRNHPLENFDKLFADVTHVLLSVPPDAAGDPVLDLHGDDLARHAQHQGGIIEWLGYLSTVGVYGDTGGKPVNETSRLLPTQERSRFRGLAETRWQNLAVRSRLPLHVFRLAGIYGPGRSPLDKVRAGRAQRISQPGHLFSRIHVADIAQVLKASMARPNPGGIYNVCDDDPAQPSDVIKYACELLGAPVPDEIPYEEAVKTMSPMAQTFWADNRLVMNDKIKDELGVVLDYPDYKSGLQAVLAVEGMKA